MVIGERARDGAREDTEQGFSPGGLWGKTENKPNSLKRERNRNKLV